MADLQDSKKLTMVFTMDNDEEFKLTLSDPKDDLTKAQVDEVMQKIIDSNAVVKDGHAMAAIGTSYITVTTQDVLA